MIASPMDPHAGWSPRRWQLTLAAVFVGQVGLVFLLSAPSVPTAPQPEPVERFRLVTDPAQLKAIAGVPWLADPAGFALASAGGFSGHIWRTLPRIETAVPEWTEPPRWLEAGAVPWDNRLVAVPATMVAQAPVTEHPAPRFVTHVVRPGILPTHSSLHVERGLRGRTLVGGLDLPVWPYNDTIQPTAIQVLVDREGGVLSATAWSGSGLADADRKALELARLARFSPLERDQAGDALTWGLLVFQWATVPLPPASTGASPK